MENVKVFALSVCVSLVVASILSMVIPNIEKNKIIKAVLSAFILSGLILPLKSILDGSTSPYSSDYIEATYSQSYEYDENTLQNLENAASASLYPIIKSELDKLGITEDFGIKLVICAENEGIKIESVNINVWDLHSIEKEQLQEQIEKNTGLPINIVASESEEN